MASRYDNIWKLLSDYEFQIDLDQHYKLKCAICNNILKNAHQGPCGCRYCFHCIDNHLKNNITFCPGLSDECATEQSDFKDHIYADHTANLSISTLEVKCPICNCKHKLDIMDDHIQSHQRCPFRSIGCEELMSHNNHLHDNIYDHSNILINQVNGLKIQMESNKENSNNDLINLKESLNKIDVEHGVKTAVLQTEIEQLSSRNLFLEGETKALKENSDGQKNVIERKLADLEKQNETLMAFVNSSRNHQSENGNGPKRKKPRVSNQPMKESRLLNSSLPLVKSEQNGKLDICSINCEVESHEFVIDNFRHCLEKAQNRIAPVIVKDAFYSINGYKFRLLVYPNGIGDAQDTYLSVAIETVLGEHDDSLKWPMDHVVTFSLMDQTNPNVYFTKPSVEIRCTCFPSSSKQNATVGPQRFIKLKNLLTNANLLKNDKIVMRLSLQIVV